MEAYPPEYYEHNLPLVLLSGLKEDDVIDGGSSMGAKQEGGARITISSPTCVGEQAKQVLQHFLRHDGTDLPWNATSLPTPSGALKYKLKPIGRTHAFPPRKAAPMPQSPSGEGFELHHNSPVRNKELHSPLSPLSPTSPVCPDGVFTPLWFRKHQQQVPALFIAFFGISASDESSVDEKIRSDVNSLRAVLTRSGFKSKFAAVLLSDQSILKAPQLEDRIATIRRTTNLDSKTGLFFMPPMSSGSEIDAFVLSVLGTLQPLCVDYYRDLTKHARRKKSRGGPPPSVTSPIGVGAQILSTSGWNVRYEVKQGVFAEFRQEMEIAERHYSLAVDELFNAEGIMETTPSWSPRWTEARLLCDCLALRILRCCLWTRLTTNAAQSWSNYRTKMKDLVDRRGKGSQTYSWDAWESRWAEIMAQLILRAQIPVFQVASLQPEDASEISIMQPFVTPEKGISSTERMSPSHFLHHPGYWHRRSMRAARVRREKALAMPDEDRAPPGQSPASAVAKRSASYDSYLVPDPHEEFPLRGQDGYDHMRDIVRNAESAIDGFDKRGQNHMADILRLKLARDFAQIQRYDMSLNLLSPLWDSTSWRSEAWADILSNLLHLLYECASHENKVHLLFGVTYELISLPYVDGTPPLFDLQECIAKIDGSNPIILEYQDGQRLHPIDVCFAFESGETNVGEPLKCQFALSAPQRKGTTPITLLRASFTINPSRTITVNHNPDSTVCSEDVEVVDLNDSSGGSDGSFEAHANLTLAPGQRRLFNAYIYVREPTVIRLEQACFSIGSETTQVQHTFTDETLLRSDSLYEVRDGFLQRRLLTQSETIAAIVHPKPPKVKLQANGIRKRYYINEPIQVDIEIVNAETEIITGSVKASASESSDVVPKMQWSGHERKTGDTELDELMIADLPPVPVSDVYRLTLAVQAPDEPTSTVIVLDVDYHLASDSSTRLHKTLTVEMEFAAPFDAKFNFGPLLYAEPWPSLFEARRICDADKPTGIPQRWRLSSQVRSLAAEPVYVHSMELFIDRVVGDSHARACLQDPWEPQSIKSGVVARSYFEVQTQKDSLDDRRATSVDTTLMITWSREKDSEQASTKLLVPHLTLPVSEPRVLCTLADDVPADTDAVLQYSIENPSAHFLTFALTMESSDEFAFSGHKYRTLSLAPLSRHHVEYRLVMYEQDDSPTTKEEGGRWVSPSLQVVDSYYNKQLRIHAGGEGVKTDEKGVVSIWIESP